MAQRSSFALSGALCASLALLVALLLCCVPTPLHGAKARFLASGQKADPDAAYFRFAEVSAEAKQGIKYPLPTVAAKMAQAIQHPAPLDMAREHVAPPPSRNYTESEARELWRQHLATVPDKNYDKVEAERRFQVFWANLKRVTEQNFLHGGGFSPLTPLADLTPSEFKKLRGLLFKPADLLRQQAEELKRTAREKRDRLYKAWKEHNAVYGAQVKNPHKTPYNETTVGKLRIQQWKEKKQRKMELRKQRQQAALNRRQQRQQREEKQMRDNMSSAEAAAEKLAALRQRAQNEQPPAPAPAPAPAAPKQQAKPVVAKTMPKEDSLPLLASAPSSTAAHNEAEQKKLAQIEAEKKKQIQNEAEQKQNALQSEAAAKKSIPVEKLEPIISKTVQDLVLKLPMVSGLAGAPKLSVQKSAQPVTPLDPKLVITDKKPVLSPMPTPSVSVPPAKPLPNTPAATLPPKPAPTPAAPQLFVETEADSGADVDLDAEADAFSEAELQAEAEADALDAADAADAALFAQELESELASMLDDSADLEAQLEQELVSLELDLDLRAWLEGEAEFEPSNPNTEDSVLQARKLAAQQQGLVSADTGNEVASGPSPGPVEPDRPESDGDGSEVVAVPIEEASKQPVPAPLDPAADVPPAPANPATPRGPVQPVGPVQPPSTTGANGTAIGARTLHPGMDADYLHTAEASARNANADVVDIDWRTRDVLTPVKSQGQCGSCWAKSAVAVVESMRAIERRSAPVPLSAQQLVSCDTVDQGCEGGNPISALQYLMNYNLASEEDYPYSEDCFRVGGPVPDCDESAQEGMKVVDEIKNYANDEVAIAQALQRGPLAALVDASTWQFYDGSKIVYPASGCGDKVSDLDHSVVIVGLGTLDNGERYWIVRNHWGPQWGAAGFIFLAYGRNTCGIALQVTEVDVVD